MCVCVLCSYRVVGSIYIHIVYSYMCSYIVFIKILTYIVKAVARIFCWGFFCRKCGPNVAITKQNHQLKGIASYNFNIVYMHGDNY